LIKFINNNVYPTKTHLCEPYKYINLYFYYTFFYINKNKIEIIILFYFIIKLLNEIMCISYNLSLNIISRNELENSLIHSNLINTIMIINNNHDLLINHNNDNLLNHHLINYIEPININTNTYEKIIYFIGIIMLIHNIYIYIIKYYYNLKKN